MVQCERRASARARDAPWTGRGVAWRVDRMGGEEFAARLAGGVGRHLAYGYGMLLLRPAR